MPAKILVVSDYHSAFTARCKVLALAEAETSYVAYHADFFTFERSSEALCAVFNDLQVVFLCDL